MYACKQRIFEKYFKISNYFMMCLHLISRLPILFYDYPFYYPGSRGLVDGALDLKPEVTQGCGFESRLRQEAHDCSPGAAQSAAHCSKCVHLDGLNAENTFHSSLYSV